jgi:prepilin-type processing-associated H-X9-DG protein
MKNWATEPIWMQGPIRNGQLIKNANGTLIGTPIGKYGYPYKLHSKAAAQVPFISDKACSTMYASTGAYGMGATVPPASGVASADPKDTCPNTAHFVNGVLQGVNAAYADGHVETHNQANMLCGYVTSGGDPYWFY